ncbi:MAG: hypothetical protein CMO33_00555 [Verrucomicrobia bacterium]|nr:hypothetical protein [Verrucomicrobiota bacterium]
MPINERYPVAELLKACESFVKERRKIITFEYILINGVNDDLAQATLLAKQAKKLRAKINIIPYNKVEGLDWKRPNLKRIDAFRRRVEAGGAKVTVRMEKGHDIDAACGQLRLRQEKEQAAENTSCNN